MIDNNKNNEGIDFGLSGGVSEALLEQNIKKINCNYYDTGNFNQNYKKNHNISFLHLNIRSLPKHFDNFNDLLSSLDCRFKVIALSETRLVYNSLVPHNLSLKGYSLIYNNTEASAGGTAIYVCNSISYRERNDLSSKIYIAKCLESTFMEKEMWL